MRYLLGWTDSELASVATIVMCCALLGPHSPYPRELLLLQPLAALHGNKNERDGWEANGRRHTVFRQVCRGTSARQRSVERQCPQRSYTHAA